MITWIVDTYMESRNEYMHDTILMEDAVRQSGYPLISTQYIPHSNETSVVLDNPTMIAIGYGTIGFLRQLKDKYPELKPGGFFESPEFSTTYAESTYGNQMLNSLTHLNEADSFPLNQMPSILPELVKKHGPLFVRPNGVGKAFSGTVVGGNYSVENFLGYIDAYSDHKTGIRAHAPDETFHVRKPIDILGEYRFVCGDNKIIASSQYRYKRVLDKRIDIHPIAYEFATKFVTNNVGPDKVYVMDVAVLENDNSARIIEFNNF
jgi:hypothetical protein